MERGRGSGESGRPEDGKLGVLSLGGLGLTHVESCDDPTWPLVLLAVGYSELDESKHLVLAGIVAMQDDF
jgi:hypothetical protein